MNKEISSIFDYHDLIAAIVAASESRDYNTAYHSVRVSNMTEEICTLLKLSEDETQLIHIAADLHDIGKLGIPDSVLFKNGRLSENEWIQMKSHPIIGEYILNKVERFGNIAKIVRHHHERWDGQGYPDQISGSEIPLGARIIAIADSIDAMLSDRNYRKRLTTEQCRLEIEMNIEKMYDKSIASIVLEHWDNVLLKRKT